MCREEFINVFKKYELPLPESIRFDWAKWGKDKDTKFACCQMATEADACKAIERSNAWRRLDYKGDGMKWNNGKWIIIKSAN